MWSFEDKGNRPVCLIPEVTGPIQELWREKWSKQEKAKRVFYTSRCYRYERPQAGRYREFTQFGIELLGEAEGGSEEVKELLRKCLDSTGVPYSFCNTVKRGLNYYIEEGFEASCEKLGAQKQIAGGGRYPEGVGWAIGVDRLLLGLQYK